MWSAAPEHVVLFTNKWTLFLISLQPPFCLQCLSPGLELNQMDISSNKIHQFFFTRYGKAAADNIGRKVLITDLPLYSLKKKNQGNPPIFKIIEEIHTPGIVKRGSKPQGPQRALLLPFICAIR
uniref:Uncharacterized protein n=1 Tax=Micrurus spixii TaxID=129469 RepID=A0A2D4LD21_9SAUR